MKSTRILERCVYFFWGSTYTAIRIGATEMPALLLAGTRFLIAGCILLLWCRWRGLCIFWPAGIMLRLGLIGLLNSGLAAAYYLRLAVTVAQPPAAGAPQAAAPKIGVAVGAALAFSALATLVLGIAPARILTAAQAGGKSFAMPPISATQPAQATPTNVQWVR